MSGLFIMDNEKPMTCVSLQENEFSTNIKVYSAKKIS